MPRFLAVASKCLLRSLGKKEEEVGLKVAFTWPNDEKGSEIEGRCFPSLPRHKSNVPGRCTLRVAVLADRPTFSNSMPGSLHYSWILMVMSGYLTLYSTIEIYVGYSASRWRNKLYLVAYLISPHPHQGT